MCYHKKGKRNPYLEMVVIFILLRLRYEIKMLNGKHWPKSLEMVSILSLGKNSEIQRKVCSFIVYLAELLNVSQDKLIKILRRIGEENTIDFVNISVNR